MTSPLKDVTQRVIAAIEAFSHQCEAIHYTDTDAAWTLLNTARTSLETALQTDGSPLFPAFLLDPATATIRTVLLNENDLLASLYRLIGCSSVDRLWLDDQHVVYFDDEGMLGLVTGLFTIREHDASPVAGRAIIVGDDGEGGDTSPALSIEAVAERFRIFRPVITPELVSLDPVSPGELGGAIIHAVRVGGLRLGLDRTALSIIRDQADWKSGGAGCQSLRRATSSPRGTPNRVPLTPPRPPLLRFGGAPRCSLPARGFCIPELPIGNSGIMLPASLLRIRNRPLWQGCA